MDGDVFEKAACLLVGLTKKHPLLTAETKSETSGRRETVAL
jgi:hypothetical protein